MLYNLLEGLILITANLLLDQPWQTSHLSLQLCATVTLNVCILARARAFFSISLRINWLTLVVSLGQTGNAKKELNLRLKLG